jgi:hypothetical protein
MPNSTSRQGCGFCPEDFFDEAKLNKNSDSIQVRIIGPTIGMAKGMLLKKRGITSIQLPKSMIKVQRSTICFEKGASFIVKNEFPSEENRQMGRFLDPDAKQANMSWMMNERRKPLSDMYQRMLIGYGVKKSDVTAYTRAAKKTKHLKHGEALMRVMCHIISGLLNLTVLRCCSSLEGVHRSNWGPSTEDSLHLWIYHRQRQQSCTVRKSQYKGVPLSKSELGTHRCEIGVCHWEQTRRDEQG